MIHAHLRRDLNRVRELTRALGDGAPTEEIREGISTLSVKSPVWALRRGCRHYCYFVRMHHGIEDRMLFPSLRRQFPGLASAIDTLEADHEEVAVILDEVDAAAEELSEDAESRTATMRSLDRLADHLFTHLDFEETVVIPALSRMDGWPW